MITIHKQSKGFTIVELLIVIVVIAILASISIVAYTGIQNRALNTAKVSDARKIHSLIQQYKAINGPEALVSVIPGSMGYCAGTDFIDLDPGSGLACDVYRDTYDNIPYYVRPNAAIDTALATVGDSKVSKLQPTIGEDEWEDSGTTYSSTEQSTGLYIEPLYDYPNMRVDGQVGFLRFTYTLHGNNVECPFGTPYNYSAYTAGIVYYISGGRNSGSTGNATFCNIHIPR